jgi:hypothetical protein
MIIDLTTSQISYKDGTTKPTTDREIFISILEKRYPNYAFTLSVGNDSLFIYGDKNDGVYKFSCNLAESMGNPIKRIAYIQI